MFLILSDPKITTWLTNVSHKKYVYVGQDEIIWKKKKKNYSFENSKPQKKKKISFKSWSQIIWSF